MTEGKSCRSSSEISFVCTSDVVRILVRDTSNFSDEFKDFFGTYVEVVEHQIIRDHETNRSRGFGFIIIDSEEVVDDLLSKGNMINMAGTQVRLFRCFKGIVMGKTSLGIEPQAFIPDLLPCFKKLCFLSCDCPTLLFKAFPHAIDHHICWLCYFLILQVELIPGL